MPPNRTSSHPSSSSPSPPPSSSSSTPSVLSRQPSTQDAPFTRGQASARRETQATSSTGASTITLRASTRANRSSLSTVSSTFPHPSLDLHATLPPSEQSQPTVTSPRHRAADATSLPPSGSSPYSREPSRSINQTLNRLSSRRALDYIIESQAVRSLPSRRNSLPAVSRSRPLSHPTLSSSHPPRVEPSTPNMSIFTQARFLAAKVEVVFDNDGVVDLLGSANTGSSYSLPGHVLISIPALPASLEDRPREVRELALTMEGKSEFFDDQGRYTPMRLHAITLDLATPDAPLIIPSHDPNNPEAARIQLAVDFDLRIPGWLPPSHSTLVTRIEYGAIAKATTGWANEAESSSSKSANAPRTRATAQLETLFNASIQATEKSSSKYRTFTLRRHRLPTALKRDTPIRERSYSLHPNVGSVSPLECIVSIPEWVDVHGSAKSLRVSLRVRAREPEGEVIPTDEVVASENVDDERMDRDDERPFASSNDNEEPVVERATSSSTSTAKGASPELNLIELGMEVEESERFSSTAAQAFVAAFPIPADQPSADGSENPLLSHRPDTSFLGGSSKNRPCKGMRTRKCLLADDGSQRNFYFAGDGLGITSKWRRINIVLPMPVEPPAGSKASLQASSRPQAELDTPFLRIRHLLKTRIVCVQPGRSPMTVVLSVPIRFATSHLTSPTAGLTTALGASSSEPLAMSRLTRSRPTDVRLPAYIQLFHENGDLRDCDPLPLYTRSADAVPTPPSPTPPYWSLFGVKINSPIPPTPTRADHSASAPCTPSTSSSSIDAVDSSVPSIPRSPVPRSLSPAVTDRSASPAPSRSSSSDDEHLRDDAHMGHEDTEPIRSASPDPESMDVDNAGPSSDDDIASPSISSSSSSVSPARPLSINDLRSAALGLTTSSITTGNPPRRKFPRTLRTTALRSKA